MPKEGFRDFISELVQNLPPIWVLAIVVAAIVAWKLPAIIKQMFTGIKEHKRVNAEIALKKQAAARAIKEKKERAQKRRQGRQE